MSKQAEDDSPLKELARLNVEKRSWEKKERGYRGKIAQLQIQLAEKQPTSPQKQDSQAEVTPKEPQKEPETPTPQHSFKFFQQYCTDCGEKNPEFKDETACKGCGTHLGSVERAVKMEHCPNCGTKEIRPITPEAVEKARKMLNLE